jgi:hypothetical protein
VCANKQSRSVLHIARPHQHSLLHHSQRLPSDFPETRKGLPRVSEAWWRIFGENTSRSTDPPLHKHGICKPHKKDVSVHSRGYALRIFFRSGDDRTALTACCHVLVKPSLLREMSCQTKSSGMAPRHTQYYSLYCRLTIESSKCWRRRLLYSTRQASCYAVSVLEYLLAFISTSERSSLLLFICARSQYLDRGSTTNTQAQNATKTVHQDFSSPHEKTPICSLQTHRYSIVPVEESG